MKSGNPVLRQTILEIVENQLRDGTPPETAATLARLMGEGYSRAKAVELIGTVVVTEIFDVLKEHRVFDPVKYAAALQALPRLPWEGQDAE